MQVESVDTAARAYERKTPLPVGDSGSSRHARWNGGAEITGRTCRLSSRSASIGAGRRIVEDGKEKALHSPGAVEGTFNSSRGPGPPPLPKYLASDEASGGSRAHHRCQIGHIPLKQCLGSPFRPIRFSHRHSVCVGGDESECGSGQVVVEELCAVDAVACLGDQGP